ncbi:hypothetical protein ACFX1S_031126 [Malus domestica]
MVRCCSSLWINFIPNQFMVRKHGILTRHNMTRAVCSCINDAIWFEPNFTLRHYLSAHTSLQWQKSFSKPNPFETKSPKPGRADANHNHETAATANKKKNKLGPNAVAMKHQVPLKPNPFETIWSRRKFDILGKRRKGEERRVGLSRSREKFLEVTGKRKNTLLKE